MAPLVRELERRGIEQTVCVTGQHRDMLDQVNALFGITPDIDLDLMVPGQTPTGVAAKVLTSLEPILTDLQPDWIVVQGDTTTVMAAAIAGAYAKVPVAHLEAGLRTGDRHQPFPEELNRLIAGSVADLHLAPTASARNALLREGKDPAGIVLTGNTVVDALLWARDSTADLAPDSPVHRIDPDRRLVLLTAHPTIPAEASPSHDPAAVAELATERRDTLQILYPVHPNPNVRGMADELLGHLDNVELCEPLDYLDLVRAMDAASFVITDSGGIQEEAPALGKPVLVLRDVTERPEAVTAGVARLVGTDPVAIATWTRALLDDPATYADMARGSSPYGDGRAAERAVSAMLGETVEPFAG